MPDEELYDLFISYGRGDDIPFVERLHDDLQRRGYNVWYDKSNLESNGISFLQNIRDALALSNKRLLLVVGPHASKSDYVKAEWEFALANCMIIIPILRMGEQKNEKGTIIKSNEDYNLIPEPIRKRNLDCLDFRGDDAYEKGLKELINDISIDIKPLATLYSVPNRPASFIARDNETDKLKEIIMTDNYKPGVITSVGKSTAVHGMGGIGKSVLAATVCHDCDVRRSFSDGIRWVTFGQNPDLQKSVQNITGDDSINLIDRFEEGRDKLQQYLHKKKCLIVLDDVWKQEHIEIFTSDENLLCRLLITTRNKNAVSLLSGNIVEVGLLNDGDARLLLYKSAAQHNKNIKWEYANLPPEADKIIKQCGHLPLAISMAGGMISGGDKDKWQLVLQCLENADLQEISKKFPGYPYPNLFRVLDASIKFLETEAKAEEDNKALQRAREKYFELSIFKEDTIIPKQIIQILWGEDTFTTIHIDNLLDILVERSLLQRNNEDQYALHDLQVDYLKKLNDDVPAVHKKFIKNIGSPLQLHHDYLWKNYIWHLIQAGENDTAAMLLLNFEWIEAKLYATDVYELISDYKLDGKNETARLLYGALKLSAQVLFTDKNQLLPQLWGRLGASNNTVIQELLQNAFSNNKIAFLKSLVPSLTSPENNENILKFDTPVYSFVIEGNKLYCPDAYKAVYIYDLDDYKLRRSIPKNKAPDNFESIKYIFSYQSNLLMISSEGVIYKYSYENDLMELIGGKIEGGIDKIVLFNTYVAFTNYTNRFVLVDLQNREKPYEEFENTEIRKKFIDYETNEWNRLNLELEGYSLQTHLEMVTEKAIKVTAMCSFDEYIVCGHGEGQLSFFHGAEKKWLYCFLDKNVQYQDTVAFLIPCKNFLLSVHREGKIFRWEKDVNSFKKILLDDLDIEVTFAYADKDWLYAGGYNGELAVFSLVEKKQLKRRVHGRRINWICRYDKQIISISDNNLITVCLFDGDDLLLDCSRQLPDYFESAIINQDALYVLSGYKVTILALSSFRENIGEEKKYHGSISQLTTLSGIVITLFKNDNTLECRQLSRGSKLPSPGIIPSTERISAGKKIGTSFFMGTASGNLYEINGDLEIIKYEREFFETGNPEIEHVAGNQNFIYTGSNGGHIELWERDGKKHLKHLYEYEHTANLCLYKNFIVSIPYAPRLYIWNSIEKRGLHKHLNQKRLLTTTIHQSIIACGHEDGIVSIYDIEGDQLKKFRVSVYDITYISIVEEKWFAGDRHGNVYCTESLNEWAPVYDPQENPGSVKNIFTLNKRLVITCENRVYILTAGFSLKQEIRIDRIAVTMPLQQKLMVIDAYSVIYIIDIEKNDDDNIICKYKADTFPTTDILFQDNKVIFGDNEGHLHILEPVLFDW